MVKLLLKFDIPTITLTYYTKLESWRPPAVIWYPCSSICIMDLLALWTIPFLHGNGRASVRESMLAQE